jgi:magnesium chelatase family protein
MRSTDTRTGGEGVCPSPARWAQRLLRVAGRTGARTSLVIRRSCRAPRHPIADVGLIGSRQVPMPGEVSLAHYGILFQDELPEFRRPVIEELRQPLEKSLMYIQSPERHAPR